MEVWEEGEYIVGDRLKPRNSVFPVLRKTQKNV